MNGPKDGVFEWFIGPLLIIKEQLKNLELEETEETCLKELVMKCKNELPEEWDSTGFPSDDTVRRAQLQAIIRRYINFVENVSVPLLPYLKSIFFFILYSNLFQQYNICECGCSNWLCESNSCEYSNYIIDTTNQKL